MDNRGRELRCAVVCSQERIRSILAKKRGLNRGFGPPVHIVANDVNIKADHDDSRQPRCGETAPRRGSPNERASLKVVIKECRVASHR